MLDLSFGELQVNIRVKAPDGVDSLYISGNIPQLGSWEPSRVRMNYKDGYFFHSFTVFHPVDIEYKYTRGSWEKVERLGSDLENRKAKINNDINIEDVIMDFKQLKKKPISSTLKGNFENFTLEDYQIIVYLPPDYYEKNVNYPVFYMHDGQNLFDRKTAFAGVEWEADESAQKLILENKIHPLIIVGVYNRGEKRVDDYTPFYDNNREKGGKASDYLKFITENLIPYVNDNFKVKKGPENTVIGGSSLGGIVSLYSAYERPDIFGGAAVVSPSVWWDNKHIISYVKEKKDVKIWLDMGSDEAGMGYEYLTSVEDAQMLYSRFLELGYDVRFSVYENAKHDEASWAARFQDILLYFYKK